MSIPAFAAVDEETNDLLTLVADIDRATGRDMPAAFLAACEQDAAEHDGIVSPSRVRVLMGRYVEDDPQRYSAMWSAFTGRGKPMVKADGWEVCQGSKSGNDGRPFRLRRWVGVA